MATAPLIAKVSTEGVNKAESELKKFGRTASSTEKNVNRLEEGFKSVGRNASAAIASIDGPLGGVASRVSAITTLFTSGTAAASALGASIAAVGGALVIGTRNLDAYNVSLKRVNATIIATGDSVGFTAQQLQDQAAALALSTLTSTQEVQAAQAQLLTFNRVLGDTFTRAIELSQDLAETGFGNITQNAVQLGKALQDPIRGISSLTEVGITFNNVQREQIKLAQEAGDVFAAQAIVIEALESQVSGVAASVATNTLAGDLDTLGQRFEEFTIRVSQSSGALSASQVVVQGWIALIEKATDVLEGPTNSELFEENLDLIFRLDEAEQYLKTLERGSAEYDRQVGAVARLSGEIEANRQIIEKRAEADNQARIAAGEAQEREAEARKRIEAELIAEQDRLRDEQAAKEELRLQQSFERNQAAAQKELDRIAGLNDTKLEAIDRSEQAQIDKLIGFNDLKLITEEEFQDALTEVTTNAAIKRGEVEREEIQKVLDEEEKANQKRIDLNNKLVDQSLSAIAAIGGAQSNAGKAAVAASAVFAQQDLIVSQAQAIGKAYAQGGPLGALALVPETIAAFAPLIATVATAAREQGGGLAAGQTSTIAERNQLEVITPASASRVRTAQQMRSIMGENGGGGRGDVNITIIDQGSNNDISAEQNDDGRIILLIRDTVSNDLSSSNSKISKSLSSNTNAQRSR